MTSDLAAVLPLRNPPELSLDLSAEMPMELSARDREAAEAVASGLRDV